MKGTVATWGFIILGSFIYTLGLNAFLVSNHLAEGGLVGISVVLFYKLHWPLWITYVLMNIPLLIPGWRRFGHMFILKTTVGVLGVSFFSWLTRNVSVPTNDQLLAALYAGVTMGFGLGLIFRTGATTGGADIIARLIRHYYGLAMGRVLFAIDIGVIGMVALVVGHQTAMYSLVALFVASRVIDFVIEGAKTGKAITIISEKHEEIVEEIHKQLERGTTLLQGQGGFTGTEKQVVYCVVSREEVTSVQRIVHAIDTNAFLVVNDVHEVLGEGFSYQAQ